MREAMGGGDEELAEWMREALHDLSQPLTALQCGLFLATYRREPEGAGGAEELQAAIAKALVQCERMITQVRAMQMGLCDQSDMEAA